MILIDTDVCIEILRGNKKIINKRKQYEVPVAVSFMTVGELFYGSENSGNIEHNNSLVEEFLLTVHIFESDFLIMKRFGQIKTSLKKNGMLLPDADLIIAATSLERCEFLVTGNFDHFKRIENLKIENWMK